METSLFLRLPSRDGTPCLPLLSLFLSFIFFPTSFCRVGLLFWVPDVLCLCIQKLFCGIYSAFKCSFDEFVGFKKVFSPTSSAILAPPSMMHFNTVYILNTTSHFYCFVQSLFFFSCLLIYLPFLLSSFLSTFLYPFEIIFFLPKTLACYFLM